MANEPTEVGHPSPAVAAANGSFVPNVWPQISRPDPDAEPEAIPVGEPTEEPRPPSHITVAHIDATGAWQPARQGTEEPEPETRSGGRKA